MRKPFLLLSVVLLACFVFAPVASFASARDVSFNYAIATMDKIIFWLSIAPEILNLILILLSLYLMLDGVRRWGTNTSGAFSRTLIGLFILHTSSVEISFLPYLALFLEIWLCARGFEARIAAQIKEEEELAKLNDAEEVSLEPQRKVAFASSTRPLLRDWKSEKRRSEKGKDERGRVDKMSAKGIW